MYKETDRPMILTTPLGPNMMFLTEMHGREGISELFQFQLETVVELGTQVSFDQFLGKKVTVSITTKTGDTRYINGIVRKMAQGNRDPEFCQFRLEIVPQFWLLTRTVRSRIFQQKSSLDIIKEVLTGLDVSYEVQGDFKSREYCVQYQESDFRFASRLMEEEGIYYFFKHSDGGHTMVLGNTPGSHPDIPFNSTVKHQEFFGYTPEDDVVYGWYKAQEIRTPKTTLWDEHFQLTNSGKGLPADKSIMDSVQVGSASHKLTAGTTGGMEIYEYPGEYSRHFDGINKGGGEQADHLQWIFTENVRTVGVRMQQEAAEALLIECKGSHAGFTAGHAFQLSEHFSDNGKFVITSVEHQARQPIGLYTPEPFRYTNQFSCIPFTLPYRPQRTTPIPSARGVQLATVVGPSGEEIFPDKYSRVKVQFHWDRDGSYDLNSSCWLRVATHWAGKQWGAIHIPRIGQEVIVSFEEGDPDHPIIVGSVYNVDMMPPYTLPDNKTQSGIKSRSSLKGTSDNYNEIRFEDKKGSEEILCHAERDLTVEVERNRTTTIGMHGAMTPGDDSLTVQNNLTEQINNEQSTTAVTKITIKCGQSSIVMDPTSITIKSMMINIDAQVQLEESAVMTKISGSAMVQIQGGVVMIN
ncbi:Rhs element Vgr protein [Candidatus Sulfopaludibacter sp. SbA4]|nr:Rhs element Vgr protein [Candidatus Sulfopaludibacter sp. SbA4]